MYTRTLAAKGISSIVVLALALLLASCIKTKTQAPGGFSTVGGTVSGLTGTGPVLQNNGGDNLAISANGPFTFSIPLQQQHAAYSVTVLTQPSGQSCTVANGTGTASANVTNVAVNCVSNAFTVGGTVSGLTGTGLVLQNNGGNNLPVSASGAFTFSTAIASGRPYSVTALTQPSGQSCTVANGAGAASANVTNVAVNCVTSTHTVGGTVSGLTGTGLALQNNGGNNLAISADGAFTFSTALAVGATYAVTVLTPPSGQGCSIANGSGSIAGANVTNVAVACVAPPGPPTLSLGFGVKELQFSWLAVGGATFYRLLENPDGVSGYAQAATNLIGLSYNYTIAVHRRLNASYILEACNSGGCTASAARILGTDLALAIGYVKASNTGARDQFGFSVALSGDGGTLAVGAPNEDSGLTGVTAGIVNEATAGNAANDAGAVYVYTRSAGAWSQQAYLKASNAGANDVFGIAVALSGDGNTLAVGARLEASGLTGVTAGIVDEATAGNAASNAGAVYVFTRSAGAWSQQAYVKASNIGSFDFFGNSVALSGDGDTLAVGAPFQSAGTTGFAGAVYVYTRSAGAWSQQAYLNASNTGTFDLFGNSVALSGDGGTLAVGAPLEDSGLTGVTAGIVDEAAAGNAASDSGAVYVYTRSTGAWSQQAYVKASNTGPGDNFGNSVTLSGDGNTLAVGAPFEDGSSTGIDGASDELAMNAGAAYVYTRSAGTWSQQAYVKASNTGGGDNFGTSVALSGDGNALAVGAPFEDGSGTGIGSLADELAPDSGAVYFYARSAGTWSQQAYVKASNLPEFNDQFGTSVALSGDGNTLAVGARFEDGSSTGIDGTPDNLAVDAGAVYLY